MKDAILIYLTNCYGYMGSVTKTNIIVEDIGDMLFRNLKLLAILQFSAIQNTIKINSSVLIQTNI